MREQLERGVNQAKVAQRLWLNRTRVNHHGNI